MFFICYVFFRSLTPSGLQNNKSFECTQDGTNILITSDRYFLVTLTVAKETNTYRTLVRSFRSGTRQMSATPKL